MPRSSASHCQQILANPDIDGHGVRVALYVQYLIAHLIFLISPEDAFDAWKTIVATMVIGGYHITIYALSNTLSCLVHDMAYLPSTSIYTPL